ncbi:MAG: hypothetical protein U0169_06930 [Polyangiaceae bacterium]
MATPDPTETEAAFALARGEPLTALGLVGRGESSSARVLRGIAYAQLGDLDLAIRSLRDARDGADDPRTRARANAALAEIASTTDEPKAAERAARKAVLELEELGDSANAARMRLVLARTEVLVGRLEDAARTVDAVVARSVPDDVHAVAMLARAEIGIRSLRAEDARRTLGRVRLILASSPHALLERAVLSLERELSRPVVRIREGGVEYDGDLFAIEAVCRGDHLLVDGCRRRVLAGRADVPLVRRPVLFDLLASLARAWPDAVPRDDLAARAFDVRRVNGSHRARLRVEIGRLRKVLGELGAEPVATKDGFALVSRRPVALILAPTDDTARLAMLLGDGVWWSAQSLAEHAGVSKSTALRALRSLVENGRAVTSGSGSARRYARPGDPLASRLVLLGLLPTGRDPDAPDTK